MRARAVRGCPGHLPPLVLRISSGRMRAVMGEAVEALPAASSTTVEMEAAEQLIQLSGGGGDDGGNGAESESRSADSVMAAEKQMTAVDVESRSADGVRAAEKQMSAVEMSKSADVVRAAEKQMSAVDSRSADGVKAGEERRDGEEAVPAVESSTGKRREKLGGPKGGGEGEEAVIGGVARRRPRFRSLAAIYRETRRMDLDDHGRCREEAEEEERGEGKGVMKKKKKKQRATDGEVDDEAAPCKAKRAVRRRTS
ncbi:hypothetical protein ZWY2020_044254 [Hordeum vulgare]|nr:hypothetical protein ZWY2020_044254 [Hordeum vulgare]